MEESERVMEESQRKQERESGIGACFYRKIDLGLYKLGFFYKDIYMIIPSTT